MVFGKLITYLCTAIPIVFFLLHPDSGREIWNPEELFRLVYPGFEGFWCWVVGIVLVVIFRGIFWWSSYFCLCIIAYFVNLIFLFSCQFTQMDG